MRRALAGLAVAVLVSGCDHGGASQTSGSPADSTASATTAAAPAYRILAKDELAKALLELQDLPPGYSQDPPAPEGPSKTFCDYPHTCPAQQGTEAGFAARQQKSNAARGARYVDDVTDVVIDGPRATARVVYHFERSPDDKITTPMTFALEGGEWAVCSPRPITRLAQVTYAGDLTPEESWRLLSDNPRAVLVDCRTEAEWRFVGVPDLSSLGREVVYVEWNRLSGERNESFVEDLIAADVTPERPVVFLCRSGSRSMRAAEAATAAGIGPAYNVLEGFEGPLDALGHRGGSGWRAVGLPWKQT